MRSRTAALIAGIVCALLSLPGARAETAPGFPRIQHYSPSLSEAEIQNFGIARDPRGTLYIANLGGILVHDGAWWRLVEIGAARSAFSVAVDGAGRVAVGGTDEIGYLKEDVAGALRYVSLAGLLPPEQRKIGQVLRILPTPEGFAFLTIRWLLLWDGKTVRTLATYPDDRPYTAIFPVREAIYVWTRDGLSRLDGRPVPGGELFRGRRIDLILPADGALLVSVRGEGLFLFKDGRAEPFAPEASRWAAENKLLEGERLDDGRWVLGSILGGALLLRPDGEIDRVIDTASGLADDFVTGMTVDLEGSLWLALNNGLARVEVTSPLSVLDARSGLKGSVYHVAHHRGELWAATSAGVFRSEGGRMRAVPGVPASGWSLLSRGDDLLAGTAFGVHVIRGEISHPLSDLGQRTVYLLAPSASDPARVWVGMGEGLAAIRKEGSGWRYEGMVEGGPREVRSIVESRGVLWCGTELDGLVRVELPKGWPASGNPRVRPVPDSFGARAHATSAGILVSLEDRLLRLDEANGRLVEISRLSGRFQILTEDAHGNLWRNTRPVSVARKVGTAALVELPARGIETIVAEPDGVVWLGGDGGLFRYEGSFHEEGRPLPAPRLARVAVAGKDIGIAGMGSGAPELESDARRLRIEFAPLSFRAGLRYQTRLDPLDSGWGAPAAEPFAELTRLPPGTYTFRVRTVGSSGETGPQTAWSFRVLPPWYRTAWALVLGILLALAGVSGYARIRSRSLSRRAADLEARVALQTRELRRTLDELQRAHDELEVANERLEELSLQDALTGVANRRRLQLALEDEWGRSRRSRSPLAFALLDLDHFKQLNDTRGHGEGDRCLQLVARFLSGSLVRHSDLVARYGGEEFAILLPETDLDGALIVAEQLRQGIEDLPIRVTASLGVASMIPAPGQRLEDLIESADRALYRAKTGGRNRVCAAPGGPRQVGSSKVATTGA